MRIDLYCKECDEFMGYVDMDRPENPALEKVMQAVKDIHMTGCKKAGSEIKDGADA